MPFFPDNVFDQIGYMKKIGVIMKNRCKERWFWYSGV